MEQRPWKSQDLETRLAFVFTDRELLQKALTHPSYEREKRIKCNNQRLEFLGDAVIGMIIADLLFQHFPAEREGQLTQKRSMLVNGQQLCDLARELKLGNFLFLGEGEEQNGGRERPSILEDAFEALVGAIYLDGGLDAARSVVAGLYGSLEDRLASIALEHNPKGQLQELLQPKVPNEAIDYKVTDISGPDHARVFTVELWIDGVYHTSGEGSSKQAAEAMAARKALKEREQPPAERPQ